MKIYQKSKDNSVMNRIAKVLTNEDIKKIANYIYEDEKTYYNMYANSIFGITNKKLGWDTLRHYEILMNGCIPLFLNIKDCPKLTLTTLPKDRLLNIYNNFHQILQFYSPFKIYKKKFLSIKFFVELFKDKLIVTKSAFSAM